VVSKPPRASTAVRRDLLAPISIYGMILEYERTVRYSDGRIEHVGIGQLRKQCAIVSVTCPLMAPTPFSTSA
jgi:hypothetical protein